MLGTETSSGIRALRDGARVKAVKTFGGVPADPKHGTKLTVKAGMVGVFEFLDDTVRDPRASASFEYNGKMVSVSLPADCLAPA